MSECHWNIVILVWWQTGTYQDSLKAGSVPNGCTFVFEDEFLEYVLHEMPAPRNLTNVRCCVCVDFFSCTDNRESGSWNIPVGAFR
jgi:hypothetical protein